MNRLDWSALVFNGHLVTTTCDLHAFTTVLGAMSELRSDLETYTELQLEPPEYLTIVYGEMSSYLVSRAEFESTQVSEPVVSPEDEIKGGGGGVR